MHQTHKHLAADGLFGNLDLYLFNLLQELRSPFGDRLLVITTELGSRWVLYSFTALLSLWLLWRRRWRATLHWLLTVGFVSLITDLLKLATRVQRPPRRVRPTGRRRDDPCCGAGRTGRLHRCVL